MSIGRFIVCVLVTYSVYSLLYLGAIAGLFADLYAVNSEIMRAPDHPLAPVMYVAYLVETTVVVWLYSKAVASRDIKAAVIFGLWMGVYMAAIDSVAYAGLNISTDPWAVSIVIHLLTGMIVGIVLSRLYKPKPVVAG